jgi:hypothetical protein
MLTALHNLLNSTTCSSYSVQYLLQVSCKAFGYRQGVALLGPASSYTAAVFNVTCTGSEDTLASCPSRQAEQQQTCRAAVLACTGEQHGGGGGELGHPRVINLLR